MTLAGIGERELVLLMAYLLALNAFAIDIMLPALQQIGADLGEQDPNRRQMVITAYFLGFGITQLFFGPLVDRFGRRPIIIGGLLLYTLATLVATVAPNFDTMLVARFLMGVGCAGPRVASQAIIRDCFSGRAMARVMSVSMMVFMIVPILAPAIGQGIYAIGSWLWIFAVLALVGIVALIWCFTRLDETLANENRVPLQLQPILTAYWTVVKNPITIGYGVASSISLGGLFGMLNSSQQLFVELYGLGAWFPAAFAATAAAMAVGFMFNARFVERLGMRRLSHGALLSYLLFSIMMLVIEQAGLLGFWPFLLSLMLIMGSTGLIMSNFNALAMEPHKSVAGTASAILGATTTTGGAMIGFLIGAAYDGSVGPLTLSFVVCGVVSLGLVLLIERGRLFRPADGRR